MEASPEGDNSHPSSLAGEFFSSPDPRSSSKPARQVAPALGETLELRPSFNVVLQLDARDGGAPSRETGWWDMVLYSVHSWLADSGSRKLVPRRACASDFHQVSSCQRADRPCGRFQVSGKSAASRFVLPSRRDAFGRYLLPATFRLRGRPESQGPGRTPAPGLHETSLCRACGTGLRSGHPSGDRHRQSACSSPSGGRCSRNCHPGR